MSVHQRDVAFQTASYKRLRFNWFEATLLLGLILSVGFVVGFQAFSKTSIVQKPQPVATSHRLPL